VFVDLGIHYAKSMRHIAICVLSGSAIFFDIISYKHDFRKKIVIRHKMCVLIFPTTFV